MTRAGLDVGERDAVDEQSRHPTPRPERPAAAGPDPGQLLLATEARPLIRSAGPQGEAGAGVVMAVAA
jgi:hypothetical protein